MGLDISAYKGIEKVDCVFDEDGEPIDPTTREPVECDAQVYVNPDFPRHAEGVEDRAAYKASESMGFCAGGYGGYNSWREQLAKLAGFPAVDYTSYGTTERRHDAGAWAVSSGPFWELINFSDCEGVIGPVISAKLAKDFQEFDARAQAISGRFYDKYQEWRAAFEMAADSGMVRFH